MECYKTDYYIIEKDRRYYQTSSRAFAGTVKLVKFSENIFDAKRYRKRIDAQRKAKETGGRVIALNPINGTHRESTDKDDE